MEETLDLKALLWNIILRWKTIIVIVIILAITLPAYKYYKDIKSYKAAIVEYESSKSDDVEDIDNNLNADDLAEVNSLLTMYQQIKSTQNYMDNSTLMKVDPYNEKIISVKFYVKINDIDAIFKADYITDNNTSVFGYSNAVASMLVDQMNSTDLINLVLNNSEGINEDEIGTLLFGESNSSQTGVFSANVIYVEGMNVEEIQKGLVDKFESKSKELQSVIPHELVCTDKALETRVDNTLVTFRNSNLTQLYSLQSYTATMESRLSEEQKDYLEKAKGNVLAKDEENSEETVENIAPVKPSVSKKYAILGILLAILIICAWEFLKMVLSAKLQTSSEVSERFNLAIFGTYKYTERKKRFLHVIDDKLIAARNRNKKKLSKDQQLDGIVASIAINCQQKEIGKLALTGTEIETFDKAILDKFVNRLAEKNILVTVLNDIYYDAEALVKAADIGNMVIIEQLEKSIKEEILNEITKAKENDINVLGSIILE